MPETDDVLTFEYDGPPLVIRSLSHTDVGLGYELRVVRRPDWSIEVSASADPDQIATLLQRLTQLLKLTVPK